MNKKNERYLVYTSLSLMILLSFTAGYFTSKNRSIYLKRKDYEKSIEIDSLKKDSLEFKINYFENQSLFKRS